MTWDRGAGARMSVAAKSNAPLHTATGFAATVERREKLIFAASLDSEDGDSFFGPLITLTPARQTLRLEDIYRGAPEATLTLTVQGASAGTHRVAVTLNGNAADVLEFAGRTKHRASILVNAAWLRDGDNEVLFTAQNGWEDVSVVEAVSVTYSRAYRASKGALVFTAPGGTRVPVSGLTGEITAIDITNPAAPVLLANEGGTITVAGNGTRTVVAADRFIRATVQANDVSDLTKIKAGVDLVIAPRAFLSALNGRAAVAIEDVYDEFAYGAKDPAAIRAFIEFVKPRSVLLAGDGSFDPRGYNGGAALDLIPVKLLRSALQRSPSDAWFTDFDNDGAADIAIGRLPARSIDELRTMLVKTAPAEGDVVFVNGAGFAERSSHATATST
ncbi:MAG TPA: C25 family cysteine peptidase [Thermoanaerobaculia bacterium]|nr:C25 family cysteine peptidase [Thermoanaerobaculia bacterium]